MLARVPSLAVLLIGVLSGAAAAQDLITEKKTFELPSYTTTSGKTIKGVRIGWEILRTAQCRQVERHPGHAFLLRDEPRRRQIQGRRQGCRLLGCDHRTRQGHRHQHLLRHLRRHAGQSQLQGPERRHHGSRQRQSRHRQALRAELPDRHHPRLRQRAEGAHREPRHQAAARRDGRIHGRAAGLRMGFRVSRRWWAKPFP